MIKIMLDTNIVSELAKGNENIRQKIIKYKPEIICLSSITEAELRFGLAKKPHAQKLHKIVQQWLNEFSILPWDSEVAKIYGEMKAYREQIGKKMPELDMMIAAHSMATKTELVTRDKDFVGIKGMRVMNW